MRAFPIITRRRPGVLSTGLRVVISRRFAILFTRLCLALELRDRGVGATGLGPSSRPERPRVRGLPQQQDGLRPQQPEFGPWFRPREEPECHLEHQRQTGLCP